jgi:hypothetical protein
MDTAGEDIGQVAAAYGEMKEGTARGKCLFTLAGLFIFIGIISISITISC